MSGPFSYAPVIPGLFFPRHSVAHSVRTRNPVDFSGVARFSGFRVPLCGPGMTGKIGPPTVFTLVGTRKRERDAPYSVTLRPTLTKRTK